MGSILCLITSGFYDGNKSIYVLGWCGQIGVHGLTENVTYIQLGEQWHVM